MRLKEINKRNVTNFVEELLDYYRTIDDNSINFIHTESSLRDNAGWYHYHNGKHEIHINIPNIMYLKAAVQYNRLDVDSFYAFVALCVGHEFRHFLQARYTKDGMPLEGYNKLDILYDELIIYIKMFFDKYYLINKGFIKCEEDAERFAIRNTLAFFNHYSPNFDGEKSVVRALNYYARLQENARIISTIPESCNSTAEFLTKIDERIKYNLRVPYLDATLRVQNPVCYQVQEYFGLDIDRLLSPKMIERYKILADGSKRDLLVVKRILALIKNPSESLESFPTIKRICLKK